MKKNIGNLAIFFFNNFSNHKIKQFCLKIILKTDDKNKKNARKLMQDNYGITIGKYSYGCYKIDDSIEPGTIIGSFCSFAPGVIIGNMNHPKHFLSTHPFLYEKTYGFIPETKHQLKADLAKKTEIESDVWIGVNAIVMPGVKIGKGAIVGAGAVVTKDVDPYTIVAGVPAKLIKKRFSDKTIEHLLQINWESWEDAKIKKNVPYFYTPEKLIHSKY